MVDLIKYKTVYVRVEHTDETRQVCSRVEAFEELGNYSRVFEQCDFDRCTIEALLEHPVTLLEDIKRCVASKCSIEMTRTILLERLI